MRVAYILRIYIYIYVWDGQYSGRVTVSLVWLKGGGATSLNDKWVSYKVMHIILVIILGNIPLRVYILA